MSEFVKVDMKGMEKYGSIIRRDLQSPSSTGLIRRAIRQWALRWRSFQQLRFSTFSRGGGGWKALKKSTIRSRRKGRTSGTPTILWDKLGSMFKALAPAFSNRPGQFEKGVINGIRVGFGGPARHPDGPATIADIATFHHEGAGHLPTRRVIDDIDTQTQAEMTLDMNNACVKLAAKTNTLRP